MARVRKIHKGEDNWSNEQSNAQNALENMNLDHLNPNAEQMHEPNR